jgi:hypothetical protein
MDLDRAIRRGDGDISVDIITGVLGQWRYYRAGCREVAKKRRVSCSEDREGHVLRIRHAQLDSGDLVRDCELMILRVRDGAASVANSASATAVMNAPALA